MATPMDMNLSKLSLLKLNGHEFKQAPGEGEGQGNLACRSPWGQKESDKTERLNNSKSCCSA